MNRITNESMPKANGHYSMCIEHNGLLYISGQLPFDPETKSLPDGITAQTQQVLLNLESVLKAAASSIHSVIQVRIYLEDIHDWDDVNSQYAKFFGDHKPVRCAIPTGPLHFGALIEIEAIAISRKTDM